MLVEKPLLLGNQASCRGQTCTIPTPKSNKCKMHLPCFDVWLEDCGQTMPGSVMTNKPAIKLNSKTHA